MRISVLKIVMPGPLVYPCIFKKMAIVLDLTFWHFFVSNGGLLQDSSDGLVLSLGIAAATGVGLLAFSEVDLMNSLLMIPPYLSRK